MSTWNPDSWREAPSPTIWEQVFAEATRPVYETVGNPLTWPASIPFAIAHGVHPKHYDAMRGMSIMYAEYETRRPRAGEETVRFFTPLHRHYLVEGFAEEGREVLGKEAAVTAAARTRMLLPLFLGEVEGVVLEVAAVPAPTGKGEANTTTKETLDAAGATKGEGERGAARFAGARVTVVWNGETVGQVDVPARWKKVRVGLPPGVPRAGVNDVRFVVHGEEVAFHTLTVVPSAELPEAKPFGHPFASDAPAR